jgi:hypothetical protein
VPLKVFFFFLTVNLTPARCVLHPLVLVQYLLCHVLY